MNANTRKKQIKPKVTIDQNEGSGSKSKAASKRFTLSKIKLNRKLFIGFGLLLIFAIPSYLFFKSNPDLSNFTILKNEVISEQNKKIDKIETQISNNNQLLLDLEKKDQVFKVTLIITILGIINVPIIKYSVDWWNTLHQPASINILSKSSIHVSMLFPLMIMTAAFALFSLLIFLMKYNTELIKIKNKGLDRL